MTYSCNVTQGASVTWTAAPVLVGISVRFLSTDPSGSTRSCSDPSSPVQCDDLDYQTTLTSVGTLGGIGLADQTSTFRFTTTAELNRTVVNCSGNTAAGQVFEDQVLYVAGEFWYLTCLIPGHTGGRKMALYQLFAHGQTVSLYLL